MMISWFQLSIALATFVISGVAAVVRVTAVVYGMKETIQKDCKQALELHAKEEDEKRAQVWRRFDEYKTMCESKFMSKEMCGVMHTDTVKSVAKIEVKMEVFIEKMEDKFDEMIKVISDLKSKGHI